MKLKAKYIGKSTLIKDVYVIEFINMGTQVKAVVVDITGTLFTIDMEYIQIDMEKFND